MLSSSLCAKIDNKTLFIFLRLSISCLPNAVQLAYSRTCNNSIQSLVCIASAAAEQVICFHSPIVCYLFIVFPHNHTHTHTAHMAAVCSQTTQPNVLLLQTKVGAAVVAFFQSYFCECGCVTICVNIETARWRCYDLMMPYVESVATCYLHQ